MSWHATRARAVEPPVQTSATNSLLRPGAQERSYVGRRPDATEVHVVTRSDVRPLAHLAYRSEAQFGLASDPAAGIGGDMEDVSVGSAVEGWRTAGLVTTSQEPRWTSG